MKASCTTENGVMTVWVEGEINTLTTPELAEYVADLSGVRLLIFDLSKVPYVSSAGLRLFLACLRSLNAADGDMLIRGCNEFMMEIFESVGYDRIMKLEKKAEA